MGFEPYDFQRHDLDLLKQNGYVGLLNMQTGSGKTAVSCWAVKESGAKVTLIICPAQTMETAWKPTVRELVGVEAREIGNSRKAKKQALADFEWGVPGVYLVTPQLATRADTSLWAGDFLVVDEAHGMASPGGKGQRKLGGYSKRDSPLYARFPMRLALSGTALRNKFELAWSHSRFLWPELYERGQIAYDNYFAWKNDRMDYKEIYTSQRDQWGNVKKVKDFYAEKVPGKWVSEAPLVITHFKRERCCEFHPNGYLPLDAPVEKHVTLDLLPDQKRAIKELEDQMVAWLDDNPLVVDLPMTKALRIRQMVLGVPTLHVDEGTEDVLVEFEDDCKSPYLDRLVHMLENEYDDEPVVVFTDSQKFASVTVKRLEKAGIPAMEYSGATRSVRDANVAEFGKKYRVVVAVLAAVAEGLDGLQRVSKTEIWLNSSLDGTLNEQARGRLDRIGGVGQVERVYFHDSLGLSEGRFNDEIEKRLELNRSLRKGGQ